MTYDGSLFIYREDLLLCIVEHPSWTALNNDREKPILIDLVLKPFRGSSSSVDMIFVRLERSKKDKPERSFKIYTMVPPRSIPEAKCYCSFPSNPDSKKTTLFPNVTNFFSIITNILVQKTAWQSLASKT